MPWVGVRFSSIGYHSISGWRTARKSSSSLSKAAKNLRTASLRTSTLSGGIAPHYRGAISDQPQGERPVSNRRPPGPQPVRYGSAQAQGSLSAPGQRLMHRADDEGAVSDGRCHPLGRAASHIPDRKHVRSSGLQKQGLAVVAISMLGEALMTPCVFAGDYESLIVETD